MDDLAALFIDGFKFVAKYLAVLAAVVVIGGGAAIWGLFVLSDWMAS